MVHQEIFYPKANPWLNLKMQSSFMSYNITLTVMYIDIPCYCMTPFSHCSRKCYYEIMFFNKLYLTLAIFVCLSQV